MSLSSIEIGHSWGKHMAPSLRSARSSHTLYIDFGPKSLPLSYIIYFHAHDKLYLECILTQLV